MDAWTAYGTAITAHKHIYIFVYIYIILINISYPLPSIYVYWVVTLKGSSVYFVFCRASVKIVSRSRHIWYARGTACTEQSNRASISSLPQSTRPLVHSHFFVTKMFEFLCTLPRVRRNEQRRSANENRKSNEDAGTVLSRKLDVLQPMERWNLKHPTNTELLNLAKDTLPEKKISPWKPVMVEALLFVFFLIQTLTEAVYSQAARTRCVHYSETALDGLLSMIHLIFTDLSCNSVKYMTFIYRAARC